jgi:hypothetical protein
MSRPMVEPENISVRDLQEQAGNLLQDLLAATAITHDQQFALYRLQGRLQQVMRQLAARGVSPWTC